MHPNLEVGAKTNLTAVIKERKKRKKGLNLKEGVCMTKKQKENWDNRCNNRNKKDRIWGKYTKKKKTNMKE